MSKSVLLIDDEAGVRTILGLALADAGYQVFTATRARDGLDIFRAHKPDAVITDLVMPGRGGCEALRVIHEESPETPVILLTGLSDQETRAFCHGQPEALVLRKPVDTAALEETLRAALEQAPAGT